MKGEDVRVKIVINHFSGGGTKFKFFANSKEVPVHFLSKTKLLRTGTGSWHFVTEINFYFQNQLKISDFYVFRA